MWPDVRIMAGIEASTITSLGTCRLVIPRSESTMASAGPAASSAANEAAMASPSGRPGRPSRMAPHPSLGLRPAAARVSPQVANVCGKKARTTWPKMIGSDTFIMVALRCTEKSTPSSLARAIWRARKACRSATRSTAASTTSPARTGMGARSTGDGPVVGHQLDAQEVVGGHDHGTLGGAEVARVHVGHVGPRLRGPGAHPVRVRPGVVLDRRRARRSELP